MRICLISREFPPETGWGGIATFVHDLALGLHEVGQEVEVIALSHDSQDSVKEYEGIKIHRVAIKQSLDQYQSLLSVMPYSHSIFKALWALHDKFIALHKENPFDVVEVPEMFGEGCFLALSKQCPLVVRLYTPHFKFIDDRLHLIDDSFDHQFLALVEQYTLLSADLVTSPSNDLGGYVSQAVGFNDDEIITVRGLVNTKRFSPEGKKALEDTSHLKVIFVGRLEERKGVYQLAQAIAEVAKASPPTKFYFIGNDTKTASGGGSVKQELVDILEKNGGLQHVVFTGPVPHASMPEYFRSADIFVLPSLYDNAPLTCLEALSSGTAIVGTSAGGMKEYVVVGESGTIIPAGDVRALIAALTDLLNDQAKRESYSKAARARALELYSRDITAQKSVELYNEAINRFQTRKNFAQYRKDKDKLLASTEDLMKKFDEMIYRLLYKRSLRFRISYWFHMFKARPKFAIAKCTYESLLSLSKILGRKDVPPYLRKLQSAIESQESGMDVARAKNAELG
jgi:glycosyltransferase involved in cell wall biosynthesis